MARIRRPRTGETAFSWSTQGARYFAHAEALYSYERAREMNTLIVGKAILGLLELRIPDSPPDQMEWYCDAPHSARHRSHAVDRRMRQGAAQEGRDPTGAGDRDP